MVRRFCLWIMSHRLIVSGILIVFTGLFLYGVKKIEVKTIFTDLLPQKHPFMKTHLEYREQLGDPFKIFMMLRVNEGDIYNSETLKKVQKITNELDLINGVNHDQIYSIASRKVKKITVTSDSIFTEKLMKEVPATRQELEKFQRTVRNARSVFGVWVSRDEKSVLFTAGFIPELTDYHSLFQAVQKIVKAESDKNHTIYAAGEPVLTGWVYKYQQEMYLIFLFTFGALFLLLYFYFRNLVGVMVPILSTCLGVIWGVGFCGLLGFNLEPLTLVIPLLITARALSHSVQITERYFECCPECKESTVACVECMSSILPPGLLGITTDAVGILLIAVAPIPIMQKLAYICGFWALGIVFTGLIFTPLILSFFPPPRTSLRLSIWKEG